MVRIINLVINLMDNLETQKYYIGGKFLCASGKEQKLFLFVTARTTVF